MSPLPITGIGPSSVLTEYLALTGKVGLVLDTTAVPTIQIADLSGQVYGPLAAGLAHIASGGALNSSRIEIAIPQQNTAHGATALILGCFMTGNVNGQLIHFGQSVGLPAPTSFGPTGFMDTTRRGLPTVQIAEKNDTPPDGAFSPIISTYVQQFVTTWLPLNWTIGENPDSGLQQGISCQPNALNETMRLSFVWRERSPR